MQKIAASFRDPAGFVVRHGGVLYRCITPAGLPDYKTYMSSGCHDELVRRGLIVPHKELKKPPEELRSLNEVALVIQPEPIPVISYCYEWSFSQLKDAALLTLQAQRIALEHDLSLKDASAYNVQFIGCKPILIDTLSFEPFTNQSWAGYRQFCQFFLGPLALMSHTDVRLSALLREYIDGIPLDLTVSLLPGRARLRPSLLLHLVSHAKMQRRFSGDSRQAKTIQKRYMSKSAMLGLVNNLERTIRGMRLPRGTITEWGDYYSFTNYSDKSFKTKRRLVSQLLAVVPKGAYIWDLGGNDGRFTKLGIDSGHPYAVCSDVDPIAVERSYLTYQKEPPYKNQLLPLVIDLTNPSPALGWAHAERFSLAQRCIKQPTVVMALALIHHLAISNNLPFEMIARYFASLGEYLIIEFVPKEDSKVALLLATRKDIFPKYTQEDFETAFSEHYKIVKTLPITSTKRILYYMRKK